MNTIGHGNMPIENLLAVDRQKQKKRRQRQRQRHADKNIKNNKEVRVGPPGGPCRGPLPRVGLQPATFLRQVEEKIICPEIAT